MQNLPQTPAGFYPGPGQAILLRDNSQQWLFQNQLFTKGGGSALTTVNTLANGGNPYASIAVQLERIKSSFYPFGASMQVYFTNISGGVVNPGAFEVDWQTSDIDVDSQYSTVASLTGGLNGSYSGRIELPTFWARFSRAYLATMTNAVYANVLITR
jgi:hypothetical protein